MNTVTPNNGKFEEFKGMFGDPTNIYSQIPTDIRNDVDALAKKYFICKKGLIDKEETYTKLFQRINDEGLYPASVQVSTELSIPTLLKDNSIASSARQRAQELKAQYEKEMSQVILQIRKEEINQLKINLNKLEWEHSDYLFNLFQPTYSMWRIEQLKSLTGSDEIAFDTQHPATLKAAVAHPNAGGEIIDAYKIVAQYYKHHITHATCEMMIRKTTKELKKQQVQKQRTQAQAMETEIPNDTAVSMLVDKRINKHMSQINATLKRLSTEAKVSLKGKGIAEPQGEKKGTGKKRDVFANKKKGDLKRKKAGSNSNAKKRAAAWKQRQN